MDAASTAVGRLLELRGRMVADATLALRTPWLEAYMAYMLVALLGVIAVAWLVPR